MRTIKRTRRAPVWLDAQAPLREWYASGLGQSILDELEAVLAERLGDVFGYQGLHVGNLAPDRELLAGAGLQRRLRLDAPPHAAPSVAALVEPAAAADGAASDLGDPPDDAVPGPRLAESARRADFYADVTGLPVASDSMKAVLFFHTLDFCAHPHQALREADRVLTDDGQLLVIGFNPASAFGLRHLIAGGRGRPPWSGRFYSRRRVADWLSVLDYRVLRSEPLFLRPPIHSERLLKRLRGLERLRPWLGAVGGLYVLQAKKQTVPMTLSRQPWLRARAPMGVAAGLAATGHAARENGSAARVVSLDSARRRR